MTPFGEKLREMRAVRGVTLKAMAEALDVSPAYLSALEHGKRGVPTYFLVQRVITFFNVIWDEAEELVRLAQVSDPRVVVDTAGLTPRATEFANRLAKAIARLEDEKIEALLAILPSEGRRR
ncbi:MAG TPA: helix-turn-helix transcriptional regulator [Beijerinckia sp.]|jgi:transcriptional regulator with XRE-family HTH domain|nr:helix-turn-helix transcriptional regulator [Beijerinckia sp.]